MKLEAIPCKLNGKSAWYVDLGSRGTGGKRRRIYRQTKEKAVQAASDKISELDSYGQELAGMSVAERAFMTRWREKMSLDDMEKALSSRITAIPPSPTTLSASTQYVQSRTATSSASHLTDLKYRLKGLNVKFGSVPVGEIKSGDLDSWLRTKGANGAGFYKVSSAFFEFCVMHDWMVVNPLARVPKPATSTGDRDVLAPETMAKALKWCLVEGDRALAACLVLGGFAGLRYAEVMRLQVEDVTIDDDGQGGEIHIQKMKTQKRGIRERFLRIEPLVLAWLQLPAKGQVVGLNDKNLREHRARMLMETGIKDWPHNALRRSYGSYHLAAYEDSKRTATLMGHTSADTTFAKYRKAKRKSDGLAWFDLTPERVLEIVD